MATIVIRGDRKRLRSAMSFAASASFHGGVLAWVVLGGDAQLARSLYDQPPQPREKKIIWYRLSEKLPEISPGVKADARPLRARVKSPQTMVTGLQDEEKPSPMIWAPDPPAPAKQVPLPNVIAVAPPKVLRPFVAPPDVRRTQPAPQLPDAPKVESSVAAPPLPIEVKGPKPAPRAFVPPPQERMARQAALVLPEAPAVRETVVEANALPFAPAGPRPRPRDFVPPQAKPQTGPVALPDAPEMPGVRAQPRETATLPKTFVPPPSRPMERATPAAAEAPAFGAAPTAAAETTLAIVGLNPANLTTVPPPPASRPSGFSAGPEVRNEGASASASGMELLNVPGLTVRGGAKDAQPTLTAPFSPTSRENLLAAARVAGGVPAMRPPAEPGIRRVTEAPDPRFAGRVVYAVAIQMPNVTSFSGSWLVWFAERQPLPGSGAVEVRAPVPLRKVDPKYVAAAVADRVEGSVRLSAVIRKDGRVEAISLLHHLDDRLDRTAQEALAKWEFTPALRNGAAVDVDAVFEIPFHLAPRLTK